MKSTYALNIRVLVIKFNILSPYKRILTMVVSQEVKLFLFIVETMFRRVDLSFVKLG